jgi:hypothetical protein
MPCFAAVALTMRLLLKKRMRQLCQTEMQAQQHCPNDTVVWLDFRKRIYYVKGQRLYAQGRTGTFVCQDLCAKICVPRGGPQKSRRSLLGRR